MIADVRELGDAQHATRALTHAGAQLWFTAPLTIVLTWLLTTRLIPRLLPYVRDHRWWRPHHLAALAPPVGWRAWATVAVSGAIGGLSHVVLDGVTHGNHSGWLVPHLPVLRTTVPNVGGPVPLHDALQGWLTLVFGAASALMWRQMVRRDLLWKWRNTPPRSLARMPRADGWRLLRRCVVGAAVGACVGGLLRRHEPLKLLAAGVGFGSLDFALLALVLSALRPRTWVMNPATPRGPSGRIDGPAVAPRPFEGPTGTAVG